jgi:hypothetical protein
MNSTDFKRIKWRDWIEIQFKGEVVQAAVLKDADNSVLVAGTYITRIRRRVKGFYQTVGPADVIRIVKAFNAPGGDNSEAVRLKLNAAIELIEDANDLA